jgi:6-phosphogluconate dehydrogenase
MTAGEFAPMVNELVPRLRAVAAMALEVGVPALGMCASLGYIDSYRSARLPQNLLQAQRDYFGAHKYERVDKPRGQQFHTEWLE